MTSSVTGIAVQLPGQLSQLTTAGSPILAPHHFTVRVKALVQVDTALFEVLMFAEVDDFF